MWATDMYEQPCQAVNSEETEIQGMYVRTYIRICICTYVQPIMDRQMVDLVGWFTVRVEGWQ